MMELIRERRENTKKIVEELERINSSIRETEEIIEDREIDFDFELTMLESALVTARLEKTMLEMRVQLDEFNMMRAMDSINNNGGVK